MARLVVIAIVAVFTALAFVFGESRADYLAYCSIPLLTICIALATKIGDGGGQLPLGAFVIRRFLLGAVAIFGVCVLVFWFIHLIPGDPVAMIGGDDVDVGERDRILACLNLDKPYISQFGEFLGNVLDGSLGHQCHDPKNQPTVAESVVSAFPSTMWLAFWSMFIAFALALPLGVLAAVKRGSWVDSLAAFVSLSGLAIPVMVMGPILISIFFIKLGWLPGPSEHEAPFAVLLPAITLGTSLMAKLSRMTRSSVVETLDEDFIRTARAKGLSEVVVVCRHALRNAMIPVITIAGMQFGALLGGAILVEKIFARPGLGTLLIDSVFERNYPVIQGTVLVIALIYVTVNLLVDLAYGFADPRIRSS